MIAAFPAMLHAKPAATLPARSWLLYAYRCLMPPLRPTRPLNPPTERGDAPVGNRLEIGIQYRVCCSGSLLRLGQAVTEISLDKPGHQISSF
jgi:hypothetical protein